MFNKAAVCLFDWLARSPIAVVRSGNQGTDVIGAPAYWPRVDVNAGGSRYAVIGSRPERFWNQVYGNAEVST